MGKINNVVSNSGPLIHLAQVDYFKILNIIKNIYITHEVFDEVCSFDLPGKDEVKKSKIIKIKHLNHKAKDFSNLLSQKYSLDLGEATSISLAKQEKINLFLTDDLSARFVSDELGLEVHGTVGIVLKAFREGIITKKKSIEIIKKLYEESAIFITKDLVNYIIKEIKKK